MIGVTGSVGKTTTKELIAAVLGIHGNVLKTQDNFNNEIGVPKTLLQLNENHTYAVVEMAMRGKGQIAELTHIARPDIGVITNVGTAHIGLLGSREARSPRPNVNSWRKCPKQAVRFSMPMMTY